MSSANPESHEASGDIDATKELLYAVASHSLSVAAIWYGSHFTLRRWITVQSLLPPEPVEADSTSSKPTTATSSSTVPVWRRFINKRFFKSLGLGFGFVAVEIGAILVLQMYATVLILDIIWSVFEFAMITWAVSASIMVLWPFPSTIKYVPSTKSKAVLLEYWTNSGKPIYVWATAGAFAGMVLSSSRFGSRVLQPVVVAAWVLDVFCPIEHFRMIVKYAIVIMNGCVFGTGALTALIMGGIELAKSFGLHGPSIPAGNTASPWVGRLMSLISAAFPPMLAGMIIALSLRYDYSKHGSSPALRHHPGEAAEIATQVPAFPKPTFHAGVVGLVLSLAILDILTFFCPTKEFLSANHSGEMVWIYVIVPTVTLATVYSTWQQGSLKQWWTYKERWWWSSTDSCQESLRILRAETSTDEKHEEDHSAPEIN